MTENDLAVVALSSIPVLSEIEKKRLLEYLDEPRILFDSEKIHSVLIETGKSDVYNSVEEISRDYALALVESYEKKGFRAIPYTSEDFPRNLLDLDYPLCLYVSGREELLKKELFCIVGSRKTLNNVIEWTKECAKELSEHFTILTGVAEGGDYASIVGADYRCVCMLPCGLDRLSEKQLHVRVRENGLLVSPFPPYVPVQKYLYHVRNRYMAMLAEGVLIVSAGERSGALITGHASLEFGKPTFSLPYSIGSSTGKGCNDLIKKGAYLVENSLDILPEYGINLSKSAVKDELTTEEKLVLSVIKEKEEAHVDLISSKINLEEYELYAVLSALEIKNYVVSVGGNKYRAI